MSLMLWRENNQDFLLHEFSNCTTTLFYEDGLANTLFMGDFMFLGTNCGDFPLFVLSFISKGILELSRFFSPLIVKEIIFIRGIPCPQLQL